MFTFDLSAKLTRLNPRLFISSNNASRVGEFLVGGIYDRKATREKSLSDVEKHYTGEASQHMEDAASGHLANFLCGVPIGFVPEHDIFDLKTGALQARGWRTIVKTLVSKGVIDLNKSRKVFGRPGLGTDQYDRLSFDDRLKWARGERWTKQTSILELMNAI
jgi:hypothetical protein